MYFDYGIEKIDKDYKKKLRRCYVIFYNGTFRWIDFKYLISSISVGCFHAEFYSYFFVGNFIKLKKKLIVMVDGPL